MRLGDGITNKQAIKSYETLLPKIEKKHGSKYDYSLSIYKSTF